MDGARVPQEVPSTLRPLGGSAAPVGAEVLAARTEIERLLDDLAEAGSEIVELRAAVGAAERRSEVWRSKYEHATAWDGRERRGVLVSASPTKPERIQALAVDQHTKAAAVILAVTVILSLAVVGAVLWPTWDSVVLAGIAVFMLGYGALEVTFRCAVRHGRREQLEQLEHSAAASR